MIKSVVVDMDKKCATTPVQRTDTYLVIKYAGLGLYADYGNIWVPRFKYKTTINSVFFIHLSNFTIHD
jgi:hypothetical protein